MKEEELFKTLIKELMGLNSLHREYKDNNECYVIDSQKEGDTLFIKVQLKENKDKKNFENWLKQIDDNLFQEVLDSLGNIDELNSLYESDNYQKVINSIKSKTREIANKKIKELQKLLN